VSLKDVPLVWPSFAHAWVLYGLVLPALFLAWVWGNRWLLPGRRVVLPLDRARGRGGWWWWTLLGVVESIPPLLLAIAIAILAGPNRNGPPQQKRSITNILFAVDVSGSMTSPFGEGTRYDASMKAIDAFLDYRKGDAFGLTFFGVAFLHWTPITTDPSAIKCSTPFMRPEIVPDAFGGTMIPKAVRACKKELAQREEGDRMIILVTDGFDGDVDTEEADLTRELKEANVTLFCVIAAEFEPQPSMVNICRLTGGDAFRADDPDVLKAVFQKIDGMKQAKVTPTMVESIDYYEPFALAALALIVFGALALYELRYTPW
jgi:Ca-activated chloride channel family protein